MEPKLSTTGRAWIWRCRMESAAMPAAFVCLALLAAIESRPALLLIAPAVWFILRPVLSRPRAPADALEPPD